MDKNRLNIAIIEPSPIVSEGLSNILLKSGKQLYLYQLTSPEELITINKREHIHIAVLNPVFIQNRISEFKKLKLTFPHIHWLSLIYTLFDDHIQNAFDGSISVSDTTEAIVKQIDKFTNSGQNREPADEELSEREKDVLKLLVRGLYNKEIAEELNISIHTVVSHRKNINEKTGIKSLSGLTVYAISKKIVDIDDIS